MFNYFTFETLQSLNGHRYSVAGINCNIKDCQFSSRQAAKNYMYKVKKTSGSSEYPSFEKISFDFEIGDDWTIYSMHCRETYKVAIKLLGRVTTTGDMTDTFSYDDNFVIPR